MARSVRFIVLCCFWLLRKLYLFRLRNSIKRVFSFIGSQVSTLNGRDHYLHKGNQGGTSGCCRVENEVNALLWQNDVGDMLVEMMEMAGYTLQSQRMHMDFFTCNVAPALGSHPAVYPSSQGWRSFMADDYSPIELRWSWSQTNAIPTIRYSIEPIGKWAGLYGDYFNTRTSVELVHKFQRSYHGVNLAWYEHFFRELVVSREEDFGRKLFDENDYKSQIFLGFDLKMQKSMLKVYFLPAFKAAATGESKLTIVERAISALPYGGHSLSNAFSHVSQYVHSFQPAHRPEVEILAIDSADPLFSRLKIYFRSRETSFDSVISMMTLGGRLKQVSKNGLARLEELWRLLLMLDYNVPTSEPLRHNDHRTAGILYYFELRIGHPFPKPKLYIPVKHYGMNDFEVARGLSTYLTSKGKQLIGDDYCNNVQRLCKHRSLNQGLGFHTYIACMVEGDSLAITSYFSPEIYHESRRSFSI